MNTCTDVFAAVQIQVIFTAVAAVISPPGSGTRARGLGRRDAAVGARATRGVETEMWGAFERGDWRTDRGTETQTQGGAERRREKEGAGMVREWEARATEIGAVDLLPPKGEQRKPCLLPLAGQKLEPWA